MSKNIEDTVVAFIESYRDRLPDEFVDEYVSLARHNECVIAFENLCVQLFEFDVVPSEQEFQTICEIGESMEIDSQRWNFLAPQKN